MSMQALTPDQLVFLVVGLALLASFGLWIGYASSRLTALRRAGSGAIDALRASVWDALQARHTAWKQMAHEAGLYRDQQVEARLVRLPIEELKADGAANVRWTALRQGGYHTLADLRSKRSFELQRLPGVGPTSAMRVTVAASAAILRAVGEPVRLPAPTLTPDAEALVRAAHGFLAARDHLGDAPDRLFVALAGLDGPLRLLRDKTGFLTWLSGGWIPGFRGPAQEARARVDQEVTRLRDGDVYRETVERHGRFLTARDAGQDTVALARDLKTRYAEYSAVIEAVLSGGASEGHPTTLRPHAAASTQPERLWPGPQRAQTVDQILGRSVPSEVARAVEACALDTSAMRVTLRGYQAFGARFLLQQRRVLLGDEMGLGKTIQALAAMHQLKRDTSGRFLVVAPASLLTNWEREAAARTDLPVRAIRGPERLGVLSAWQEHGGLGLVSYETCARVVAGWHRRECKIDMLVVDEAHFAKNPQARRSKAIASLAVQSDRVCLMTGTPLENRRSELAALIALVRPDLAAESATPGAWSTEFDSQRLHRRIAEAYLRRNREDVLKELPGRIDKDEWVDLGPEDVAAYREAVRSRSFMAMRRAASSGGGARASKLHRVLQILEEYQESGRKVLVYSFFLDVLGMLEKHLGAVVGTLSGGVPQNERTRRIDEFRRHDQHGVLLCQITTGGLGLNLQAASAVILMEPQWKPTSEEQAVARAHRMGQTETVVVHRLLARDSVDERMVEVLRGKRDIFDAYVRRSALRDASPAATETRFADAIMEAEARRLQLTA